MQMYMAPENDAGQNAAGKDANEAEDRIRLKRRITPRRTVNEVRYPDHTLLAKVALRHYCAQWSIILAYRRMPTSCSANCKSVQYTPYVQTFHVQQTYSKSNYVYPIGPDPDEGQVVTRDICLPSRASIALSIATQKSSKVMLPVG